jgi:hypothetical protein
MIALDRLGLSATEHLICCGLVYIRFPTSSIALEADYSVTRTSCPYYSYRQAKHQTILQTGAWSSSFLAD